MTTFQTVLADVFDRGAERRIADPAEERSLIDAAKKGDEAATIALVYAYAPALRNAVKAYARNESMTAEDARSAAIEGFLVAIQEATSDRLAGTVAAWAAHTLADEASSVGVAIPTRTLQRFYGVLRRADGDLDRAAEIAPEFDLSREALYAIAEALRAWESLDATTYTEEGAVTVSPTARSLWEDVDAFAAAEDRILAEVALAAVEDDERAVCRHSYGFESYRPKSDAEVAYDLGLSRPTVQRKRAAALSKMRDRLAVDEA